MNHIGKYKDEYGEYDLYYTVNRYENNNRIALDIDDPNEGPYARVTINLTDVDPITYLNVDCWLDADKYQFINGDLTEDFKKWLREKNIISDPVTTIPYNYGRYELCKILVA